jgi:hypothetical protein
MKLTADSRSMILLLLLCSCLWATRLRGPIDLRWDAATYYVLGTSLAQGEGYRLLNEPGEIEAVQYPPLLPAVVAAHQLVLGTADPGRVGRWLRITYAMIYVLYVLSAYRLARLYLGPSDSLLAAALAALPVHVVFLSDLLFAELPYALLTVLFAYHAAGSGEGGRVGRWHFATSALLGAMAFLARTTGLALLAAWVAEPLIRGRWKSASLRGAVAILPVIAWQAYIGHVQSGEAYRHPAYEYQRAPYLFYNVGYGENARLVDPFRPELGLATPGALAGRFAANVASVPAVLGRALFTGRGGQDAPQGRLASLAYVSMGLLILGGLAALARRRDRLIPLYVGMSLALICTTPWPSQFGRYTAPLAPFLALAMVSLLRALAERLPLPRGAGRPAVRSSLVLAAALLMIAKQSYSVARVEMARAGPGQAGRVGRDRPPVRFFFYGQPWAGYDDALAWLKGHAESGEVVAATSPQQAFLETGLKAVMFPMEADPGEAQRLLDAVPVRYLIRDHLGISDISDRYAAPVLGAHPGLWERIYASPEGLTEIYRRERRPDARGHSARR